MCRLFVFLLLFVVFFHACFKCFLNKKPSHCLLFASCVFPFFFGGSIMLSVGSALARASGPRRALPEVPVWVMRKALASGVCGLGCATPLFVLRPQGCSASAGGIRGVPTGVRGRGSFANPTAASRGGMCNLVPCGLRTLQLPRLQHVGKMILKKQLCRSHFLHRAGSAACWPSQTQLGPVLPAWPSPSQSSLGRLGASQPRPVRPAPA